MGPDSVMHLGSWPESGWITVVRPAHVTGNRVPATAGGAILYTFSFLIRRVSGLWVSGKIEVGEQDTSKRNVVKVTVGAHCCLRKIR